MNSIKKFYIFSVLISIIGIQLVPKFGLDIGLKPDDILFSLLFISVSLFLKDLPRSIVYLGLILAGFTLTNVFSSIINDGMSNILFPVRYMSYGLALILGYQLQHGLLPETKRRLIKFITIFASFQFLVTLAQKNSLLPGVYDNVIGNVALRPTGLSSHPTELGFINLVFLTLFYQLSRGRRGLLFYGTIALLFSSILLSESRTGLISGLAMILIFELFERRAKLNLKVIKFVGVFIILPFAVYFLSTSERIKSLTSYENISFAISSLQQARFTDFDSINPLNAPRGVDQSLYVRITKWSTLLHNSRSNLWIGTGPGSYGIAIDGLFVRVFGESGLLGLFFYLTFLTIIFTKIRSAYFKIFFIFIMGSSLFIDTLFFSRFAYLFYLYSGLNMMRGSKNLEDRILMKGRDFKKEYDRPQDSDGQHSPT